MNVPRSVRLLGWFYYLMGAVGAVGGVVDFIRGMGSGMLNIPLPVGVGLSAWAIGRGLQRGSLRAWKWARFIAGAMATMAALILLLSFFDLGNANVSFPGGSRTLDRTDPWLWLVCLSCIGAGGWQWRTLHSPAAKQLFHPDPPPTLPSEEKEDDD